MVRRSELDVARRGAVLREKRDKARSTHIVARFLGLVDGDDSKAEISVADGEAITVQCAPGRYVVGALVSVLVDFLGRPVRVVSAVSDRPEYLIDLDVNPVVSTAMKTLEPVAASELSDEDRARLEGVESTLADAKAVYDARMLELSDATETARTELEELATRLDNFETEGVDLSGIRAELDEVRESAFQAQSEADALRVEADRLAQELGETDARVVEAKEAADAAQARADYLQGELAKALKAAQDAQATANQATLDARDAHNVAVDAVEDAARAQLRADEAVAKALQGDSLLSDPSFETGAGVMASRGQNFTRHNNADVAFHGDWYMSITAPGGTGNVWTGTYQYVPVQPGQVIAVSAYARTYSGTPRFTCWAQPVDAGGVVIPGFQQTLEIDPAVGSWKHGVVFAKIPVTATQLRLAPMIPASHNTSSNRVLVDMLTVVDVTAEYGEIEKAQAAADQAVKDAAAAQARADSAYTLAEGKADQSEVADIRASVNGKNSITISTTSPTGSGVAVGDLWWRRDAENLVYAQWTWDGARWVPSLVRNEMLAGLDVHKLQVTGDARISEAVVKKLFSEVVAANRAYFNQVTVASSENLIPGADQLRQIAAGDKSATPFKDFGINATHPSIWLQGGQAQWIDADIPVKAGTRYRFSVDVMSSVTGTVFYLNSRDTTDTSSAFPWEAPAGHASTRYPFNGCRATTDWTTFTSEVTSPKTTTIRLRIYANHSRGAANPDGYQWFRNLRMQAMTGAVLIEDGAVTADKIAAKSILGEHLAIVPEFGTGGLQMDAQGLDIIPADTVAGTAISLRADQDNWISFAKGGVSTFAVSPAGDMSVQNISVNGSLFYRGTELMELLAPLPRGLVGRSMLENTVITNDPWTELCAVTFDIEPGRAYRAIGVAQATSSAAVQHGVGFKFAHSDNFSDVQMAPTNNPGQFSSVTQVFTFNGDDVSRPEGGEVTLGFFGKSYSSGAQIAFQGRSSVSGSKRATHMHIEDIGPSTPTIMQTGTSNISERPTPTKREHTKTFAPTWVKNWRGGSTAYTWAGRENTFAFHGRQAGTGYQLSSMIGFGTQMQAALAGSEIISVRLTLYNSHTYSNSGGTFTLNYHGDATAPSAYRQNGKIVETHFPKGYSRTIKMGVAFGQAMANGSFKGIALNTSSTSNANYGYFDWAKTRITVKYRK